MQHSTRLSQDDIEAAVQSGQRAAAAHEAFSTDVVRLAFGKTGSGRIVHVTDVDRGLSSETFCPACSERLIARQGKKKAWHFAHANGHACRDALSGAMAAWLAQCLNEKKLLVVPALSISWGGSSFPDQPAQEIQAEAASYGRMADHKPFEVRVQIAQSDHQLRILFRTARTSHFPSSDMLAEDGVSTVMVDIYQPLSEKMSKTEETHIDIAWLTRELLECAPRRWLWSLRESKKRTTLRQHRLGRHIAAFEDLAHLCSGGASNSLSPSEACLEQHGLMHLTQTPSIPGERFLGPWPAAWRAAIVSDLLLQPFQGGMREVLLRDAGFGRREIISTIARKRLVLLPDIFKPLSADDEAELKMIIPDLRRPLDIVEDYLAQLAARGAVCASTRKTSRHKLPTKAVDDRLNALPDIDWVAAPDIMQHAMRVAAAEAMLK